MDTKATVSSVTVTREYGNITNTECKRYQRDRAAVVAKEMSFGDFLMGLRNGSYSIPMSSTENGEFCGQVELGALEDTIVDYDSFVANEAKLKPVRIRKVTSGGSFSSHTKAKIKLSLPVRAQYVSEIKDGKPIVKEIVIRGMTLYHPSPVRIENVQHDAVLSLNDPGDDVSGTDTVVLIPLRAANSGAPSESFFNKLVKHIVTLSAPDDVTGLFPRVDVPTGSDWSIKNVFWLGDPDGNGYAPVQDSFYSWDGSPTFNRKYSKGASFPGEVEIFGWEKSNNDVRYFMIGQPVNISTTDLSILTRNLPPTPPDQAIHGIPDAELGAQVNIKGITTDAQVAAFDKRFGGAGVDGMYSAEMQAALAKAVEDKQSFFGLAATQKEMDSLKFFVAKNQAKFAGWPGTPIIYKVAEGKALCNGCSGGVERGRSDEATTNEPSFEAFGNMEDVKNMYNEKLSAAESIYNKGKAEGFSPSFLMTLLFAFITFVFMAIGAWIALYLIHRDYDYAWTTFSTNAGKVVGSIIKKLSPPSIGLSDTIKQSIPKMMDAGIGKLAGAVPGADNILGQLKGAAPGENGLGQGLSLLKGGPSKFSGLMGKSKF